MLTPRIWTFALCGALTLTLASPQRSADRSYVAAQSAADIMRDAAGADIAFWPAGIIRDDFSGSDLSRMVDIPGDILVVSELSGKQIKAALDRSISLYPSANDAFLYLSGVEVRFKRELDPAKRVVSIKVGGSPLDLSRKYKVALPMSLARGGYGYFTVWDKKAIVHELEGVAVESLLKGKTSVKQTDRWTLIDDESGV
ncbi:MAG: 5'-nucleotidase C-terminal domain-containing protein [Armatimonadetes bacterium]|nr:5'-nucleotidase C-terminal domain-containing protein [Armatimonadota bacterium]